MEEWARIALRDLCSIARGGSPRPIENYITDAPDGINWIKIGDTQKGGRYIDGTAEKIKPEGRARSRYVEAGSFLLSNSMSFGRPYILRTNGCIHDGWLVLEPDYHRVNQDFLYHVLSSRVVFDQFDRLAAGSTVRNLNIGLVEGVEIPLPPLEEQQRIVAILDETFEGLDRARANAEANLQSARDLFESIKANAIAYQGKDSETVTLADVAEIASSLVDPREAGYAELPHLGAGNMVTGSDELVDVKTAREEKLISGKFLFDDQAVLYSKIRPYLRKAARPDFAGLCSADVYPLTPVASRLDRDFLFHLLLGTEFTNYAISGSDRAGMPKVNRDHLFAYQFDLPPLAAQKQIAAFVDEAHNACDAAIDLAITKLSNIANLRQSLLQRAFVGELTSPKPHHVLLPANDNMHLSAQILALGYSRHQSVQREKTYGHVKAQKLLHLAETVCGYDLGRVPIKDAAGPNDMPHMRRVEDWAKANQVFEFQRRPSGGYTFVPLEAFSKAVRNLQAVPEGRLCHLVEIVDLLVPMDSEDAEVLATVHAAWSNLIKDGAEITDESIVTAAREDWHPDKMKIERPKFFDAIRKIKAASIEPDGTARYVEAKQARLL